MINSLICTCAVEKFLSKAPVHKADFSRAASAISKARTNKVARYLPNPEANWGPKPKHGRKPPQKQDNNGIENGEQATEDKRHQE